MGIIRMGNTGWGSHCCVICILYFNFQIESNIAISVVLQGGYAFAEFGFGSLLYIFYRIIECTPTRLTPTTYTRQLTLGSSDYRYTVQVSRRTHHGRGSSLYTHEAAGKPGAGP